MRFFLYLWVTRTNEWKLAHLEEIFIGSFFLDISDLDFVFFINLQIVFIKIQSVKQQQKFIC